MMRAIAYSAIDEGTLVFGDSAIRALFDDMSDFGSALTANADGANRYLSESVVDMISEIVVQHAGHLAFEKVEQAGNAFVLDALTYYEDGGSLSINFNDDVWTMAGNSYVPERRFTLVNNILYAATGDLNEGYDALAWYDASAPDYGKTSNVGTITFDLVGQVNTVPAISAQAGRLNAVLASEGGGGLNATPQGESDDLLLGSSTADTLTGGAGKDILLGSGGDDRLVGGSGSDWLGGGEDRDTADYAEATAAARVVFVGTGEGVSLSVEDGTGGTDSLHSIEAIILTTEDDSFAFSGVLPNGFRLTIDANGGQYDDIVDLIGAVGTNIQARITADGVILTSFGSTGRIDLVGFHTTILGSDTVVTTFIGAGTGAVFVAGAAGGDFTLMASDSAYGYEGIKDVFRVTTTAPAGLSDADAIAYLQANRVAITNIGAEDEIFVNGIRFDGNTVTSTLAPVAASDRSGDMPITSARLTGDSSYGTAYPIAELAQQGLRYNGAPWGPYAYTAGDRVRDVSLGYGSDQSFFGPANERQIISFVSRSIMEQGGESNGYSSERAGYRLGPLTAQDEMLVIILDGFVNGEAGVEFGTDVLARNVGRPNAAETERAYDIFGGSFESRWGDPEPMAHVSSYDQELETWVDGFLPGGGAMVGGPSDSVRLNAGVSWEDFLEGRNGTPLGGGDEGMMQSATTGSQDADVPIKVDESNDGVVDRSAAIVSAIAMEQDSDTGAWAFQDAFIYDRDGSFGFDREPLPSVERLGRADWFRPLEESDTDAIIQLRPQAAMLHMEGPGAPMDFFVA